MTIFPKRLHPDFVSCIGRLNFSISRTFSASRWGDSMPFSKRPGYNLLLHTAPLSRPATARFASARYDYSWHLEIVPRFNSLAGFEIGLGAYINTVYPRGSRPVSARRGAHVNVVLLWHMHQPYYVNPLTKKAMMPWVRLHAAKGYLDMIDLVTAQPGLRVNFNFSPRARAPDSRTGAQRGPG